MDNDEDFGSTDNTKDLGKETDRRLIVDEREEEGVDQETLEENEHNPSKSIIEGPSGLMEDEPDRENLLEGRDIDNYNANQDDSIKASQLSGGNTLNERNEMDASLDQFLDTDDSNNQEMQISIQKNSEFMEDDRGNVIETSEQQNEPEPSAGGTMNQVKSPKVQDTGSVVEENPIDKDIESSFLENDQSKAGLLFNQGKPWSKEDAEKVAHSAKSGPELARELGRSVSAIWSKRVALDRKGYKISYKKRQDWNEEEIKQLHNTKLSNEDLSIKLGKTVSSIASKRSHLKLLNRETPSDIVPLEKEILKKYFGELKGLDQIGLEIHKDRRSFKSIFRNKGIHIPNIASHGKKIRDHLNHKYDTEFPKDLNEIIDGTLLGDANLRLNSKTDPHSDQPSFKEYQNLIKDLNSLQKEVALTGTISSTQVSLWNRGTKTLTEINTGVLRFHKSILEKEFVNGMNNDLKKYVGTNSSEYLIKSKIRNDDLPYTIRLDTRSNFALFDKWKKWYIKNPDQDSDINWKKILPEYIVKLSPDTLLHWFVGDGTYSGKSLELYSFNFSKQENERLVNMLNDIDISAKVHHRNDRGHFVRISSKIENRAKFFSYMEKAKHYDLAKKSIPHKFDRTMTRKDGIRKFKEKNPEYQQ